MAKTAQFELIGTIVDHPKYKDLSRGDILTLEVGDDGKPTSELFRSRTRPLGKAVDQSEGLGVKGANAEAAKILEGAGAKAKKILEDAEAEATLKLQTAEAEAQDIIDKAKAAK
jgi:hypothetical protein